MKPSAIIQARMSSSRLPGKVLLPLLGEPLLARVVERARFIRNINQIIVATSQDSTDDPIEDFCHSRNIPCFRGSLHDVLGRYYGAALKFEADPILRLTADCPLLDSQVLDQLLETYNEDPSNFVTNVRPPSFPDGLDGAVFSFEMLRRAFNEATLPSEREHVVPWMWKQKVVNVALPQDLSHYRWTLDEPQDYIFIQSIYKNLYAQNPRFDMNDVLALLKREPGLNQINSGFERDAGYFKSLEAERGPKK